VKMSEQKENGEKLDPEISQPSDKASGFGMAHEPQFPEIEIPNSPAPAENEAKISSLASRTGGPRTPKGKERSKLNALKHGLFSKKVLMKGDSRADFKYLLNELRNDRQPVGILEEIYVEKFAAVLWVYRRILIKLGQQFENVGNDIFGGPATDWMQMQLLLLKYATSFDRELERNLKQLERLQLRRLGQPVPPSIDVNVATV
jgi:hypothetical protein